MIYISRGESGISNKFRFTPNLKFYYHIRPLIGADSVEVPFRPDPLLSPATDNTPKAGMSLPTSVKYFRSNIPPS